MYDCLLLQQYSVFVPNLENVEPGRPIFDTAELLEDLLGLGFSQTKVAEMLGVSCWALSRSLRLR